MKKGLWLALALVVTTTAHAQRLPDLFGADPEQVLQEGLVDLGLSLLRQTKVGSVTESYVFDLLPVEAGTTVEIRLAQASLETARRVEQAWAEALHLDPAEMALSQLQDQALFERLIYNKVADACRTAGMQVVLPADEVERWSAQRVRERANPEVRQRSVPAGGDIERPMLVCSVTYIPLVGFDTMEWLRLVLDRRLSTLTSELHVEWKFATTGVSLGSAAIAVETRDIEIPRTTFSRRPHARPVAHAHLSVAGEELAGRLTRQRELTNRVVAGLVGLQEVPGEPGHMRLAELAGLPDPRVFAVYQGGYALVTAGQDDRVVEDSVVRINGVQFEINLVAYGYSLVRLMDRPLAEREQVKVNETVELVPAANGRQSIGPPLVERPPAVAGGPAMADDQNAAPNLAPAGSPPSTPAPAEGGVERLANRRAQELLRQAGQRPPTEQVEVEEELSPLMAALRKTPAGQRLTVELLPTMAEPADLLAPSDMNLLGVSVPADFQGKYPEGTVALVLRRAADGQVIDHQKAVVVAYSRSADGSLTVHLWVDGANLFPLADGQRRVLRLSPLPAERGES